MHMIIKQKANGKKCKNGHNFTVKLNKSNDISCEEKEREKEKDMIDINNMSYHVRANLMTVYANPDGYVAPDGGSKGGYLIRSVKDVFSKPQISAQQPLDDIIKKIRARAKTLAGKGVAQCVEIVSTMTYHVRFEKR